MKSRMSFRSIKPTLSLLEATSNQLLEFDKSINEESPRKKGTEETIDASISKRQLPVVNNNQTKAYNATSRAGMVPPPPPIRVENINAYQWEPFAAICGFLKINAYKHPKV